MTSFGSKMPPLSLGNFLKDHPIWQYKMKRDLLPRCVRPEECNVYCTDQQVIVIVI